MFFGEATTEHEPPFEVEPQNPAAEANTARQGMATRHTAYMEGEWVLRPGGENGSDEALCAETNRIVGL